MKKNVSSLLVLFLLFSFCDLFSSASSPDSAYIFAYTPERHDGRHGLVFAWSLDQKNWHGIGPEHNFLSSDYGSWGSEKRMYTPYLLQAPDGIWHCVWSVNDRDGAFAHATSANLIDWKPQSYPIVTAKNCLLPNISYDSSTAKFMISWMSGVDGKQEFNSVSTGDFRHYSQAESIEKQDRIPRAPMRIGDEIEIGTVHRVTWQQIDDLINEQKLVTYNNQLRRETTDDDPERFKNLKKVDAEITADGQDRKKISDSLIGIFFEDINYAADGGLYAELIQNRGFEYKPGDKKGQDPNWHSLTAWSIFGEGAAVQIDSLNPVHQNNKHFAVLTVDKIGAGLVNDGFDGIPIKAGEKYDVSLFVRLENNAKKKIRFQLVNPQNEISGETTITVKSPEWSKLTATIQAEKTVPDARLLILPQSIGTLHIDMISLFPRHTFNNRKNGLRADLAQVIADIHPRFVRFPGGCVAHGDGLGNMYRWKNTIGPLEARIPQRNIWGYHQSAGLGYFEYFQFCEDIGAEPIPIVPAGVPCQNSSTGGAGQQCGIPMSKMDDYIQEVLDLIEWANGDKNSTWGQKRAEAGHPEPFNLKYIGVGNEDLISEIFKERFAMIYKAVQEKYPEITVIGTVGPFYQGSDYEEGWRFATKLGLEMVDEHYYQPPGWFIHNQDFYDKYDRSKAKVYLGEYAGHLPGRPNNIETALSEALYLTAVERNGDVVQMTSYAPLLAKEGHTQWNPDLIYFNNTEVKPTVGYYVQKLFGHNSGDTYISTHLSLSEKRPAVQKRVAISLVQDSQSGDLILKMINLLPVDVSARINLENLGAVQPAAVQTVLSGDPDDIDAKPVSKEITVENEFESQLAAYSFTVIRIKTEDQAD